MVAITKSLVTFLYVFFFRVTSIEKLPNFSFALGNFLNQHVGVGGVGVVYGFWGDFFLSLQRTLSCRQNRIDKPQNFIGKAELSILSIVETVFLIEKSFTRTVYKKV